MRSDHSASGFAFRLRTSMITLPIVSTAMTPVTTYRVICHQGVIGRTVALPMFMAWLWVTE